MKKGLRLTSILLVFTMLLLLGVRWAERDNRLNLTRVRIDNSSLVDSVAIAEVLRPYFGSSLLKLDTDFLKNQLQAIEGVDSVSVVIHYPETIHVSFSTRKPAVILAYSSREIPVTVSGDHLPADWVNDQLPVIEVVGDPDASVIESALLLLTMYPLSPSVSMQVSNREIVVTDNGLRIILDPERAAENWLSWRRISTIIPDRTDEVDLRYKDQAVLRFSEET